VIAEKFTDVLGRLHFGDDVLSWITKALRESHADEQKEYESAILRLQVEYERLQRRMHAMCRATSADF
jgi:site-specific DNA recombinase